MLYSRSLLIIYFTCHCPLVAQSCLTLCDPMDCGPPGSSVHGILQVRILEWAAISSSDFISSRVYINKSKSLICPSFLLPPLVTISLFPVSMSLVLLCK